MEKQRDQMRNEEDVQPASIFNYNLTTAFSNGETPRQLLNIATRGEAHSGWGWEIDAPRRFLCQPVGTKQRFVRVGVSSRSLLGGEVFKLHSWASNGNECSTLLVAKAPMQAMVPIFSRIHECFIFSSHLMLTSYLSMSNKDVYCKEIL